MSNDFSYDPIAIETINNPNSVYDQMLANNPVHWHEQMNCWVVARYDDCREVLANHEVFARDWRRAGDEVPLFKESVQSMDPPSQTPIRNLFLSAINAQPLEEICRSACASIALRLNELKVGGPFDFQSEVSAPYAMFVISRLLGVPQPDLREFATISEKIAKGMDAGLDPATAEPADAARKQLYELVDEWLGASSEPGLIATIRAHASADDIPSHILRNTIGIVFNAGFSTTYATTGNATLTLLTHPTALSSLRDRAKLSAGIEELLRFDGPAQGTSRVAIRDAELAGVRIRKGDVVLALFAAANRDPRQFNRPGELILDRTPNRHLGFGWGPHACLGAALGLTALTEYVSCLANFEWPLELAGQPSRRRTATLRCLHQLPVRVLPS